MDNDTRVSLTKLLVVYGNAEIDLATYREYSPFYSPDGDKTRCEAIDNAEEAIFDFLSFIIPTKE